MRQNNLTLTIYEAGTRDRVTVSVTVLASLKKHVILYDSISLFVIWFS